MEIQAISLDSIAPSNIGINSDVQQNDKAQFSELLGNSISGLNESLVHSNQAIEKLALGQIESTHEIVIAMEKAKMSLQIAVEVRNKLVEAYQQLTRMQI